MTISRRTVIGLIGSAVAVPGVARAEEIDHPTAISVLGSPFRVDGNQTGIQTTPSVAATRNGGFMVGWYRRSPNLTVDEMFVRYFSATGVPAAAPLLLESDLGSPVPVAFNNGTALVIYETGEGTPSGNSYDIFAQRMSAAGTKLGSRIHLNTTKIQDNQTRLFATRLSTGDVAVVWLDESGTLNSNSENTFDVRGRVIEPNGSGVTADLLLTQPAASRELEEPHAVAPLANGGFVVAYAQLIGEQGPFTGKIYLQRYDAAGVRVGAKISARTFPDTFDVPEPALTALPNGGFAVAHSDSSASGAGLIKGRFYSASGAGGANFSAVCGIDGTFDLKPKIAALPNGTVAVVSGAFEQIGGDIEQTLLGFVFSASGQRLSGPTRLYTAPSGFVPPQPRSLVRLNGGTYVASFTASLANSVRQAMALRLSIS